MTPEIKLIISRIIDLLALPKPVLQKSCLVALRRATIHNEVLCLEILNSLLMPAMHAVLDSSSVDNKLECLGLLNSLMQRGHVAVYFV